MNYLVEVGSGMNARKYATSTSSWMTSDVRNTQNLELSFLPVFRHLPSLPSLDFSRKSRYCRLPRQLEVSSMMWPPFRPLDF